MKKERSRNLTEENEKRSNNVEKTDRRWKEDEIGGEIARGRRWKEDNIGGGEITRGRRELVQVEWNKRF
ncbi:hypothetical protein V2J09_004076 [Rumex salicifolius]